MPLTRYAPTPSGYLHAGNLLNFEITRQLAEDVGADIALRIDDADASRYRREFVEDIFDRLRQAGLDWTIGPTSAEDFEANWSQRRKTAYYREHLDVLRDSALVLYACTCSRKDIADVPVGGCPGGCRSGAHRLEPEVSALRVAVDPDTTIEIAGQPIPLGRALGDFVVWRRDDLPAYQLVSVIEDRDLGTTHIVRGEDLLDSSAAQIFLARALGAENVLRAHYVHHELVLDADGRKLSKSQQAPL